MSHGRIPWHSATGAVLIASFSLALVAPTVDALSRDASLRNSMAELRAPAPMPPRPASFDELSSWPARFTRHFDDTFGHRDRLLRARNALLVLGLTVAPNGTILPARERWIFYGGAHSMEDFRGVLPLSFDEIDVRARSRVQRGAWLARRGIRYVHALAPNKETIYPERVPERFDRVGPSGYEQLLAYLREHPDPSFVDLRGALRDETRFDAPGDYVYSPGGTHWTSRGAWAAWGALRARLSASFPALARVACARPAVVRDALPTIDSWATQLFLGGWLEYPNFRLVRADSGAPLGAPNAPNALDAEHHAEHDAGASAVPPRVLLLHDSFGAWIVPSIREDCPELLACADGSFPKPEIESFRPDLVIEIYTERDLRRETIPFQDDARMIPLAEFEELAPLGGPCDLAASPAALAIGGVDTRVLADESGSALELVLRDATGGIALPRVDLEPERALAVRIAIDSPHALVADVFFPSRDDPTPRRTRCVTLPLARGANDVAFVVPESGSRGSLVVRLGTRPGRFVVRRVEQRATGG